jgi:hypothetical protein
VNLFGRLLERATRGGPIGERAAKSIDRRGLCAVCLLPVASHYDKHNRFISCVELRRAMAMRDSEVA